jgi:GntR family transcriptional regulator, rspAB operon transcriptional repressor
VKETKVEESLIKQETIIVPPRSISDQIYEVLKERILLGKIASGERIIESNLAENLKTSRTPVREAFQRLVQDGLVERVPQGGVRVTVITPRMIKEVFGIRAVLEVYALQLACDTIEIEAILKLKDLARQARRLLVSPGANDPERLITLWEVNTLFHETIYRAAGSEHLLKMISQLNSLVRRFRFLSMRKTRTRAWDQHELIIRYLEDRDKPRLGELMKLHIESAASDTLKALENDQWEKDV